VRLLWVGRLVETKNVRYLIQALSALMSDDWMLDILGDGTERPALEAMVASLRMNHRVAFRGHVPAQAFYANAELLLTASRMESAGLVIPEAMSYGVPTLAMRPDGNRYLNANDELIDDGHNGFLANGEEDFAMQLASLLRSRSRLQAAGAEARRTAEERHSWTAHLDAYERMFRDIVRDGGPR
jgi:glycosyltransferase involved in cell wall biosynthesis